MRLSRPFLRTTFVFIAMTGLLAGGLSSANAGTRSTPGLVLAESTLQKSTSAVQAAAPTSPIDTPLTTPAAIRAEYGFEDDAAYIAKVAGDSSASKTGLGIPLLPSEVAEIQRRNNLVTIAPLIEAILKPLGIFGGDWIDNPAGGILRINVTALPSATIQAQINTLMKGQPISFEVRSVSESALEGAVSSISNSPLWKSLGIYSVGIDPTTSTIKVTIPSSAPAAAESTLTAQFGSNLVITRAATGNTASVGSSRMDSGGGSAPSDGGGGSPSPQNGGRDIRTGPMYGGEAITHSSGGYTYWCTLTYGHAQDPSNGYY